MDMKTKKEIAETAYSLMVMLGEIQNDMNRSEEPITMEEINELYGKAVEINEYFNE